MKASKIIHQIYFTKKIKNYLLYPIALFVLFFSSCSVIDNPSDTQISTDSNTEEKPSIPTDKESEEKPTEHNHVFEEVDRIIEKCDESAIVLYQCSCGESYQQQVDSD